MNAITLYDFQLMIRDAIDTKVNSQWVAAEISEIKINNTTGHCYMELVEKNTKNSAIPKAKATAIIWRSTLQILRPYFYEQTGQHLVAGMKVLVYVTASFHELYGLSLVIKDIDPTYTLGDMERQRQQTIAQLTQDGVFEMNRETELPQVIERIAVISSATAAGYEDFIRHLRENEYSYTFHTTLFPALVQGEEAENSMIAALYNIADHVDDFDCVVLIRGGGSQSDMACFNSYGLCSYIAQFPLPVIAGIGHNKDISVADMVAHTSVKTPTAAANMLIDLKREYETQLDTSYSELIAIFNETIKNENERITTFLAQIKLLTKERVHIERLKIADMAADWKIAIKNRLHTENKILSEHTKQLSSLSRNSIIAADDQLRAWERMLSEHSKTMLSQHNKHLELLFARTEAFDPQHILKLGFSIVTVGGRSIRSISEVQAGENIKVKLSDGEIEATVK